MNQFELPASLSITSLKEELQQFGRWAAQPSQRVQRVYHDTFDWRLYRHGAVLMSEEHDSRCSLQWLSLPAEEIEVSQPGAAEVRLLSDFPDGAVRRGLSGIVEMRALLPLAQLKTRLHVLELHDKRDKTVLRLNVESSAVYRPADGRWLRMNRRLRLLPVRGYTKPAKKVHAYLVNELGLHPASAPAYAMALERLGIEPGAYTSKPDIELNPDERADAATKRILLRLLDVMDVNEDGVKQDLDSEFLHDFRVAVRRTRVALAQIKDVFPPATLERFRSGFAWLGEITGPTRDLDVYLLRLPEYQASLPTARRDDLQPLAEFLVAHQREEQHILKAHLNSARYRRFVRGWRDFLLRPVPQRPRPANARRVIAEVAGERIWRTYRRVTKEGRAISSDSPDEALHELRKTCKKLRYLLEFFSSLYPPRKVASLISELKRLQDNLGEFQDYHVQVCAMESFVTGMEDEQRLRPATREAVALLVEILFARQEAARSAFHDVFERFAAREVGTIFRALFREQPA